MKKDYSTIVNHFGDRKLKVVCTKEMVEDLLNIKPLNTDSEFDMVNDYIIKQKNELRKKKLDSL
jgi:hypothetical protein